MSNGDIVLLLVLVGSFLVGFVWGTARSLMFLGGGAAVFLIAAHARPPLSGFLSREWTNFAPAYNDMLAMLVLYVLGLLAIAAIVGVGARNTGLSTRAPDLDRLIGGMVGVAAGVMVVAGLDAILGLFYGYDANLTRTGGAAWSATLHEGLLRSEIGAAIHRSLLPALGALSRPLLPFGFAEAFGDG
jgi:uncharacterized membrane protein required for colicin V production